MRSCVHLSPSKASVTIMLSLVAFLFGLFLAMSTSAEVPATDASPDIAALEAELRDAETAFAGAFAAGDMAAFASFLDDHAVFMGRSMPLRGKQAIVERWTRMRGEGDAPFSWRPERVAVEADGQLGLSTGPVTVPDDGWVSSFVSTWRMTADGWKVVLDVGPRCPPSPTESSEP